jgi:2-haloacid dehalogenase
MPTTRLRPRYLSAAERSRVQSRNYTLEDRASIPGPSAYLASSSMSRRSVLAGVATAALATSATGLTRPAAAADLSGIKALAFDIYGTSVDYWGTIVTQGQALGHRKNLAVDWPLLASDWPAYPPSFTAIYQGKRPWESFVALRRESLDELARKHGLGDLSDDNLTEINAIWQRLEPWADTRPGLRRLRKAFILATLGNADMADVVVITKHNDLPFDVILTAELARSVKPDPKVYQLAPRYLGLRPDEILMVACHKADLHGARAVGLRTAFVARPMELGPKGKVDAEADSQFDLNCKSFVELADLLHR